MQRPWPRAAARGARRAGPAASVVLVFVAASARWLWHYRRGQPLDIDEAGYLGTSLYDFYALVDGGIAGWLRAVEAPSIQAPLTTALSSLVHRVAGPSVGAGYVVPVLAGAATIAAAYGLGAALGARRLAILGALLVASCPIVVTYSRSYHFAMPATAVATAALLALVRSERFAHPGWSAAFGACLGLMPLARTMTIAFLPGFALAGAVHAATAPSGRARRLLALGASLLLAAAVAALWLGPNGSYVFRYLTSFGYGARAAEFGAALPFLGVDRWLGMAQLVLAYLYVPHALVLVAGAVALVAAAARRCARSGMGAAALAIARARAFPILVAVAAGIVALASSRNQGSAFLAPLVPAWIVVSLWALERAAAGRARLLVTGLAVVVAMLAGAPLVDLGTPLARPVVVRLPALGPTTLTDGRGTIQLYVAGNGWGTRDSVDPLGPALGRAWVRLSDDAASWIAGAAGPGTAVAFGFRHRLFNVNTVALQQLLRTGHRSAFRQIEPMVTGDSAAGYAEWLTRGDAADAGLLLLTDGHAGEFPPAVREERLRASAGAAGFALVHRWSMPDGQGVTAWRRGGARTPAAAEAARSP